jgi:hypothetical protein
MLVSMLTYLQQAIRNSQLSANAILPVLHACATANSLATTSWFCPIVPSVPPASTTTSSLSTTSQLSSWLHAGSVVPSVPQASTTKTATTISVK